MQAAEAEVDLAPEAVPEVARVAVAADRVRVADRSTTEPASCGAVLVQEGGTRRADARLGQRLQ
jgi:hypothetical protein